MSRVPLFGIASETTALDGVEGGLEGPALRADFCGQGRESTEPSIE